MNCESCKEKQTAAGGDQYTADIVKAYAERSNRRLFIIWIVTFIMLVATNAFWIWRDSQFVDESWTYEAEQTTDGGGSNTFIGGDMYGTPNGQGDQNDSNP